MWKKSAFDCLLSVYYLHIFEHDFINPVHSAKEYMEQRIKRDSALINLVSEFEANFENGNIVYLEEKTFFQLIGYYEEEREFEKALDVAMIAINQYKYRAEFHITVARLLLKVNALEECLKYLQIAESIAPCESEIILLKVKALAISGEYDLAFIELDNLKAYALKGDMVDIHICESEIYAEMSQYPEMYDSLKKALLCEPKNEIALEKIWVATELSKKYIECGKLMNELIDRDPYNSYAWYNLGHSYSFIGEYEKAIDAMEYSYIIEPNFENGYVDCAELCCQVKNFERAQTIYEEALQRFDGDDVDLLLKISECQLYLNKTEASKQNLYKAIKMDPYNDEIYYFLAECFRKEGKWYSSINAYHKAIEIEDSVGDYYLGLAHAYVAVEDYNKATINFQLAVGDGPEQTHFWRDFASFLIKLGLLDEALQILDEADDYTFGADLLYCRALILFLQKDKQAGLNLLEEALDEDFSIHTILFNLAPELEVDKDISGMIHYYAGEL